jgi:two-component sensor histidine kinase
MPHKTRDYPKNNAVQLAEIHHRLKNCLATVQAIIQFTNNTDSIQEFKEKVAGRIKAYVRVQDILIESQWRAAPLRLLIDAMLAPYNGHTSRKRFHVDGEDYEVWPAAAELFSFAANELATNSSKYGALSHADGFVKVRWQVDAEHLTFTWQDVDGPPVAPPLRKGFGSNFIERYTKALHGTLLMTYESHGAGCTICIPLPSASVHG